MDLEAFQARLASPTALVATGITAYVVLCRSIRYLRCNRKHAQYPYQTRADMAKMTTQDAFEIVKYIYSLEFPWMVGKSLSFALFRTYGIPTISKLLCQTANFSSAQTAPRVC
jgi:hypothetical protein